MSRPQVKIHNIETDEIVIRDMNDEELAAYQQFQTDVAARIEKEKADKEAREALLGRLGITEDEARLLLA